MDFPSGGIEQLFQNTPDPFREGREERRRVDSPQTSFAEVAYRASRDLERDAQWDAQWDARRDKSYASEETASHKQDVAREKPFVGRASVPSAAQENYVTESPAYKAKQNPLQNGEGGDDQTFPAERVSSVEGVSPHDQSVTVHAEASHNTKAVVAVEEKAESPATNRGQQVGVVVDKFDQDARVTPLLLSLAQVKRVAKSLLAIGVKSPHPLQLSDMEYAMQTAVEILSVADALRVVAGQWPQTQQTPQAALASPQPLGEAAALFAPELTTETLPSDAASMATSLTQNSFLVQLPAAAKQALEWLISLQTMLDVDNFAQMFPGLPVLKIVAPNALNLSLAQRNALGLQEMSTAAEASLSATDQGAQQWPVVFVQLGKMPHQIAAHTVKGATSQPAPGTVSALQPSAGESLPSWLFEAKPSKQNALTYGARPMVGKPAPENASTATLAINTSEIAEHTDSAIKSDDQLGGQSTHSAVGKVASYGTARDHTASMHVNGNNGLANHLAESAPSKANETPYPSRQSLDAQAERLRSKYAPQLPPALQDLAYTPAVDSEDYASWLERVAEVVRDAERHVNRDSETRPTVDRPTYVFDDNNVMLLLKMLPLAALRDVIRQAAIPQPQAIDDGSQPVDNVRVDAQQRYMDTLGNSEAAVDRARKDSSDFSARLAHRIAEVLHEPQGAAAMDRRPLPAKETSAEPTRFEPLKPSLAPLAAVQPPLAKPSKSSVRDIRERLQDAGKVNGTQQSASGQRVGVTASEAQMMQADMLDDAQEQARLIAEVEGRGGASSSSVNDGSTRASEAQATPTEIQAAQARAKRLAQIQQLAKQLRAQITQQVLRQTQDNTARMELQLNPRRLGKMTIEIMQDAGKTLIKFTVEQADTLERLRADIDTLIESLREAGVKTDQGAMEFTLKEGSQQQADEKRKKSTTVGTEEPQDELLALGEEVPIDDAGHVNVQV